MFRLFLAILCHCSYAFTLAKLSNTFDTVPCFKAGIPTWQDPQVLVSVLPILLSQLKRQEDGRLWITLSISQRTCWAQTDLKTFLPNPPVTGCTLKYNHIQTHLRSTQMTTINVISRLDLIMILSWSYHDLIMILSWSCWYLTLCLSAFSLSLSVLRGNFTPVLAPLLCTNIRCQGQNSLCRFHSFHRKFEMFKDVSS